MRTARILFSVACLVVLLATRHAQDTGKETVILHDRNDNRTLEVPTNPIPKSAVTIQNYRDEDSEWIIRISTNCNPKEIWIHGVLVWSAGKLTCEKEKWDQWELPKGKIATNNVSSK